MTAHFSSIFSGIWFYNHNFLLLSSSNTHFCHISGSFFSTIYQMGVKERHTFRGRRPINIYCFFFISRITILLYATKALYKFIAKFRTSNRIRIDKV